MGPATNAHSDDVVRLKPGDSRFPAPLLSIPSPPSELFVRGDLPASPRVALVGSREADDYALRMARELGRGLAAAGLSVVSGGAGGVDTAALRACLDGGGRVVAVLGTGVDIAYPAANRDLFDEVAGAGALVSEYPPGTAGHPSHFPRRNRLISGLSDGVVVIRAARKSGSLITAREAVRQGRGLMAVPGRAGEKLSAGVHELLRRGAILVESVDDILRALSITPSSQPALSLAAGPLHLAGAERALWEKLGAERLPIDVLTERTGLSSNQVASVLLEMELKGLVEQQPGMVYCRSRTSQLVLAEGE